MSGCTVDASPIFPLAQPGYHIQDWADERVTVDIPLPPPGSKEEQQMVFKEQGDHLSKIIDDIKRNPSHIAIICDRAVPRLTTRQATAAWRVWYRPDLTEGAAPCREATSNNTESLAISFGMDCAFGIPRADFNQIDVFSDSVNAIELVLNPDHHTAHQQVVNVTTKLALWLTVKPEAKITLHHVQKACGMKEHLMAHNVATCLEVDHAEPWIITLAKARKNAVELARTRKYISRQFLPLYKDGKVATPSHLKGGTWLHKVALKAKLTAQLMHAITGHAPIGTYRQRFLKEMEGVECECSLGIETVEHVIRYCTLYKRAEPPERHVTLDWITDFLHDNPGAFTTFRVPQTGE